MIICYLCIRRRNKLHTHKDSVTKRNLLILSGFSHPYYCNHPPDSQDFCFSKRNTGWQNILHPSCSVYLGCFMTSRYSSSTYHKQGWEWFLVRRRGPISSLKPAILIVHMTNLCQRKKPFKQVISCTRTKQTHNVQCLLDAQILERYSTRNKTPFPVRCYGC